MVERVVLHTDRMEVTLRLSARNDTRLEQTVAMILRRRGVERRIVIAPQIKTSTPSDPQILKALRIGLRFWEQLNARQPLTAVEFAKQEGVDNRYVGRAMQLTFLAPNLIERLVSGQHPPEWTADRLLR
jgi:site-specific DNA recombinase